MPIEPAKYAALAAEALYSPKSPFRPRTLIQTFPRAIAYSTLKTRLATSRPSTGHQAGYNEPVPDSSALQKVRDHLQLYEHPLLAFTARENNGAVEVLIDLKNSSFPVHTYVFPIHPRDLDHPQFAWHLQRQLYDALHDYFIEMFTHTPQDRDTPRPAGEGRPES